MDSKIHLRLFNFSTFIRRLSMQQATHALKWTTMLPHISSKRIAFVVKHPFSLRRDDKKYHIFVSYLKQTKKYLAENCEWGEKKMSFIMRAHYYGDYEL